jgi:tripartite ATP-independent transporter DctP family solute receptor
MKRRLSLSLLILVMVLVITTTGFSAGPVTLKWYQPEPMSHPWSIVGELICKEVIKRSNGRLQLVQYPAGALGTQAEAVDMLRMGSLAFLTSGPTILASFYEPVQVFSLPYLFKDREQAYRVIQSKVGQKIFNDIILKKSGIRTIDFWYFGVRTLTTKDLPVTKPSDLAGVKIRCMDVPVAKNVIKALGASPTPVNFNELYLALQTGVVQGQENPIATIYSQKFYEVQDYIINTNHSVHVGTVHVSEQIWQRLSKKDRKMILDVFKEYKPMIDQKIDAATKNDLQKMVDRGVKVINPDVAAFQKYADKYIWKVYGKDWGNLIKQIKAVK